MSVYLITGDGTPMTHDRCRYLTVGTEHACVSRSVRQSDDLRSVRAGDSLGVTEINGKPEAGTLGVTIHCRWNVPARVDAGHFDRTGVNSRVSG